VTPDVRSRCSSSPARALTIWEVCDVTGFDNGKASFILYQLEHVGLITLEPMPGTPRYRLVPPTPTETGTQ
jgi:hypothetical protein